MKPSELIQQALDSGTYKTAHFMCVALDRLTAVPRDDVLFCRGLVESRISPYRTLVEYMQVTKSLRLPPTYAERVEFWLEFVEELKKQNR